jgi:hypothetical protein
MVGPVWPVQRVSGLQEGNLSPKPWTAYIDRVFNRPHPAREKQLGAAAVPLRTGQRIQLHRGRDNGRKKCPWKRPFKARFHGRFLRPSSRPWCAKTQIDPFFRLRSRRLLTGLDLLPILPCALRSAPAVGDAGRGARPQQYCQSGRFFLLILRL